MPPTDASHDLHDLLAAIEADAELDAAVPFIALAADYLRDTRAAAGTVSTSARPEELLARFREPMPRTGRPLPEVIGRIREEILPDCNRLYHPKYVGHQVSPPLPAAAWMESLTAVLNQSVAVWEMSPVATVLETQVVRWLCECAGFGPAAGGTLTSGGTEATFAALLAARSVAIPDVWEKGVGAEPPAIVCGEHAHYAVTRAAGEMGLGMRAVVVVPSRDWRMDVEGLARTLDELHAAGRRVMAVVATAGSTATGSFDDLEAIASVCERHGAWLHVDAAHGGSALLSAAHRGRLRGIERAHSVAWDPHKMMLLPLSAGVVLVRDELLLEAAFSQRAPYLFHGARGGAGGASGATAGDPDGSSPRSWDQGIRSFQCSRRADVFKLWVALQRYGADGIGALYDHLCSTTRALHAMLDAHPRWMPLHEPECNILCFRWIGAGGLPEEALDEVNLAMRERLNRSGAGWITTTVLGGQRVLRVTVMNPRTTSEHLQEIIAALDELGAELNGGVSSTPS